MFIQCAFKQCFRLRFREHILDKNHNYKDLIENLTILDLEKKCKLMNGKEDLPIYMNKLKDPGYSVRNFLCFYYNPRNIPQQ